MTLLANINVGSSPNDGTGDSLRTSFTKCNDNFQILDTLATEFTSGNLYTNVISNGSSTFNVVVVNTSITSNLFSGNGSALTNVAAVTANSATYAAQVTGNTQTNITTVGTLGNLTVAGTILTDIVEAGTIGNSGATLVGTLTTAAQPNITSLGVLTGLTMAYGSIASLYAHTYSVVNPLFNNLSGTANIRMWSNRATVAVLEMNSNVTLSYLSPIESGIQKYYGFKNSSMSTQYIILPNSFNNKGSNTVPVTAGATASIIFFALDNTDANLLATINN